MIHPSTMAGPAGLSAGFGTTNPFQQNLSTFIRSTPFQTSGFGPGTTPFQSQPFGFGNQGAQVQNTINEIVRQTIPSVLANYGIQPNGSLQSSFGFPTNFGFPQTIGTTPFGLQQFQLGDMLQNQGFFSEIIRQATNQALQNLGQQTPFLYGQGTLGPTQSFFGTSNTLGISQQQYLNQVAQCCQQVAQCTAQNLVQCGLGQNPGFVAQCCQAVTSCLAQCLLQFNPTQLQNTTFNPTFNLNNTPQFGVNPGIPAGAGAF
jgi:hypothetical protein